MGEGAARTDFDGEKGGGGMRLWHKDLIPVLPRKQLVGQWRECCLMAKNIAEKGSPNHILVNRIIDYPIGHFTTYTRLVYAEMLKRGYGADFWRFKKWMIEYDPISYDDLFSDWHNDRYRTQCLVNLQEKYDCGGISEEEWNIIRGKFAADYFFGLSIWGVDWKQFAKLTCCDPFKSRKPQQS